MRSFLHFLRAIQKPLNVILDVLGVLLLVALVFIISQEVFMRYVMNRPGKWSEELAIALLIWFGYLGITVGYRDNKHLSITVFADRLSGLPRLLVDTFADAVMIVFCVLMAWQGVKVAQLDAINTMPATGISMYWVSIVLTVSGCAMVLEGMIKILSRFYPDDIHGTPENASDTLEGAS